jgi:uncharacterized damage-inducible protein DinB
LEDSRKLFEAVTTYESLWSVANHDLAATIRDVTMAIQFGARTLANSAVSQYLFLLDEAFHGGHEPSLLNNLRPLELEDWAWILPGGNRSIRDIVRHVTEAKLMYDSSAFGDGQLTWDRLSSEEPVAEWTLSSVTDWVTSCHERFQTSISALDDDDLTRPRMTHWGEPMETRWIIAMVIEHDIYHAGEINHIRYLRNQLDRSQFEQG